jgi:hypothetical protein
MGSLFGWADAKPAAAPPQPAAPLTEEEKKRGTAHHEAGHAVLTVVSRFYQLSDPAMKLEPTPDRTAQSGTRPRAPGQRPDRDKALEHVEIALAGKAAERLFEEITEREGRRIALHSDSAWDDLNYAGEALRYWGAEDQHDALMGSAYLTIKANQEAWEEIADLAVRGIGVVSELSKAEVEALPAVQKLIANKRSV